MKVTPSGREAEIPMALVGFVTDYANGVARELEPMPTVLVMAKAPRRGRVQTRLHPLLGPDGGAILEPIDEVWPRSAGLCGLTGRRPRRCRSKTAPPPGLRRCSAEF